MKISIVVTLLSFFSFRSLAVQEPSAWVELTSSADESFWLAYREETVSELYEAANGTVIPMALLKTPKNHPIFVSISPFCRKLEQVEFEMAFRSHGKELEKISHNFFSKGADLRIPPIISVTNGCCRIQIPEEGGKIRNLVILRGSGIEDFKKRLRISPLMPAFEWKVLSIRQL
jgi:hypothetical protein